MLYIDSKEKIFFKAKSIHKFFTLNEEWSKLKNIRETVVGKWHTEVIAWGKSGNKTTAILVNRHFHKRNTWQLYLNGTKSILLENVNDPCVLADNYAANCNVFFERFDTEMEIILGIKNDN